MNKDAMLAEDRELIAETQGDFEYLEARYAELQEKYPGECVAIKNANVVAHSHSLDLVLEELEEQGVDSTRVVIERILPEGVALVV